MQIAPAKQSLLRLSLVGFLLVLAIPPVIFQASAMAVAAEKDKTVSPVDGKTPAAAQEPAAKQKLPPRRVPAKRKGEISFDDILFEIKDGQKYQPSLITKPIKALQNKVVTIRGFILPASVFQQVGIRQFVLVRDNQECCFGPGAALYDCVMINMVDGNTAEFSTRPIAVKGKFSVTEKYKMPDGSYLAIYEMHATQAK